jgi:hypothetical protein
MAKSQTPVEQPRGDPPQDTTGSPSGAESLGEQLIREAREGQAELVAAWQEFMNGLGIQGQPIGAKKLRERLLQEGIKPENNEFSKGIIAMREE